MRRNIGNTGLGSRSGAAQIKDVLNRHREEERRDALRALLMSPLMTSAHPHFGAVRRHAQELRDWFSQATGWLLHVELDCARLYKRPADLKDASRGAPGFDRRRYTLFCLACAVLERAEPQVTLRSLGDKLLVLSADPALSELGFSFTLESHHERRELVAVCRFLLTYGVLQRVAGDEDAFVSQLGDALYDVHRRVLAGLMAAWRGPSTWTADSAPQGLEQRLAALTEEFTPDSDEGRRTAMRHQLARRLLDDPVIYLGELEDVPALRAYFQNQRGALASRLCEASGLLPEQRAEGLALVDDTGELTDLAMPATGTGAHVTLLVAEFLAAAESDDPGVSVSERQVSDFILGAMPEFGRYWNKAARTAGAEQSLAREALARLAALRLVRYDDGAIRALPALARFTIGKAEVRPRAAASTTRAIRPGHGAQTDLFR